MPGVIRGFCHTPQGSQSLEAPAWGRWVEQEVWVWPEKKVRQAVPSTEPGKQHGLALPSTCVQILKLLTSRV